MPRPLVSLAALALLVASPASAAPGPAAGPGVVPVVPGVGLGLGGGVGNGPVAAGGGVGLPVAPGPGLMSPSIAVVGAFGHGSPVSLLSSFYDSSNDLLWVEGTVSNLPGGGAGWTVIVMGQGPAPMVVDAAGNGTFGAWVDVSTSVPPQVPYRDWLIEERRAFLPVLAELVDTQGLVADRARVLLYDLRNDDKRDPAYPVGGAHDGYGLQLTPSGLSDLQEPHRASLPWPDLGSYLADLQAASDAQPEHLSGLPADTCVTLSAGHPVVQNSAAYALLFAEATAGYAAYETLEKSRAACGLNLACLALYTDLIAEACFHEAPAADTFEVCATHLGSDLTGLTISGVDDVTLQYVPAGPTIEATPTLGDIDGDVTAWIEGLTVKWGGSKGLLCAPRPERDFTAGDLVDPAIAAWSTCSDLRVDADSATPGLVGPVDAPLSFDISAGVDPELLAFDRVGLHPFLAEGPDLDVGAQVCSEGWLSSIVADDLLAHLGQVEDILTDTWDDGAPQTPEADALEALFAELELGTREPVDHTLDFVFANIESDDVAGARFTLDTEAAPRALPAGATEATTWFRRPSNGPLPYSVDGEDPWGDKFDLAAFVTTGQMNQALRALTPMVLEPTYELGVVGVIQSPQGVTYGKWVNVHPALGTLPRVTATVRPTLDPLTLMALDNRPPESIHDLPVSYQVGQLLVELKAGPVVFASYAVDAYDPDITIEFDPYAPGGEWLSAEPSAFVWDWTPLDINIVGCDRVPYSLAVQSCETALTGAIKSEFEADLDVLLWSLLQEVPGPYRFEAVAGAAADVDPLDPQGLPRRSQSDQVIRLYADLD